MSFSVNFPRSRRVLVSLIIFISIYSGALFVFATQIPPGSTLDPAGLPGAYTVHVLGFDTDGFLDTGDISLANSSSVEFYLGDSFPGIDTSGGGIVYNRGGQVNGVLVGDLSNGGLNDQAAWIGYLEPGATENSIRVTPTYLIASAIDDSLGNRSGLTLSSTSASLGGTSASGTVTLDVSVGNGIVFKGLDDLSTTQNFKLKSDTDVELLKVMNDGTYSFTRSVGSDQFKNGTFDFLHPILGDTVIISGSRLTLSGGDSFDNGIFTIPSLPASGSGQHYISTTRYQGFDVTTNDASLYSNDLSSGEITAVTVDPTRIQLTASPDGSIVNNLVINGGTDGFVFNGADDLDTSTLVNLKNNSGTSLMHIFNDGKVGIGDNVTPTHTLDVAYSGSGTVASFSDNTATCIIDPTGNDISCSSDARLKKNITSLDTEDTLQKILGLRGVTFQWAQQLDGQTHIGFIAQELETVFPEFINVDARGYKTVSYASLTPVLVEALKAIDMKLEPLTSLDISTENSLASLLEKYLSDATNGLTQIFAGKVQTKELCLEDVCITKTELKEILESRR